jgi:DinB superfamily
MTDKEYAAMFDLPELLIEYDRARAYTDALWRDLSSEEVSWRPTPNSSAIGWHLGHQAHVAHFMLRNLTAAEASPNPALDALMDSANPEPGRGNLPSVDQLAAFRAEVAARIHARMTAIDAREVGAPEQQRAVGRHLLTVLINHEYQHDRWIGEVRERDLGHSLPPEPAGARLTLVDNYLTLAD